jgi:hypothetical protein
MAHLQMDPNLLVNQPKLISPNIRTINAFRGREELWHFQWQSCLTAPNVRTLLRDAIDDCE